MTWGCSEVVRGRVLEEAGQRADSLTTSTGSRAPAWWGAPGFVTLWGPLQARVEAERADSSFRTEHGCMLSADVLVGKPRPCL